MPPRLDREADRVRSAELMALLDEHFVIPRIPNLPKSPFMTAIVGTLSMAEAGEITPKWLRLAVVSATELLAY